MACRDLVIGMWTTLFGRKWIPIAIGFTSMALFGLAALAGQWFYRHREYLPDLMTYLPWFLAVLFTVKLATAGWIMRELRRRGLVSTKLIQKSLAMWAAVCLVLIAMAACLINVSLTLVLGIGMAVPIARIAAAPLALHWNRHR
jgi:hypothetical protein